MEPFKEKIVQDVGELAGRLFDHLQAGGEKTAEDRVLSEDFARWGKDRAGYVEFEKLEIRMLLERNSHDSVSEARRMVNQLREALAERPVAAEESIRQIISHEGGIFIGRQELVVMGFLDASLCVAEFDLAFSPEFLLSPHPLRQGTIASHLIVIADPANPRWIAIDRGLGGIDDVIPGTLRADVRAIDYYVQSREVEHIEIEGVRLQCATRSYVIEEMLMIADTFHRQWPGTAAAAPFAGAWAYLPDFDRFPGGVVIGNPDGMGMRGQRAAPGFESRLPVGLLGVWSQSRM